MLYTNLKHIENHEEYLKAIHGHKNVMIICGRMDPESIQVYAAAEALAADCCHISMYDIEADSPYTQFLQNIPEVKNLSGIPFIVCFKNGNVVSVSRNKSSKAQITELLDNAFGLQLIQR